MKIKFLFLVGFSLLLSLGALHAQVRKAVAISEGWKFTKGAIDGAEASMYDDSRWDIVDLPHTWNNQDGQDGGNNYYRGVGWYRKSLAISYGDAGKHLYLKFNASNCRTDVYVNGMLAGTHMGGFAAFIFDITPQVVFGKTNVIAVRVENAPSIISPPLEADFTFFGGITRVVELLVLNPVAISPLLSASSGVFVTQRNVSRDGADVMVTATIDNNESHVAKVELIASISNRDGKIVESKRKMVSINPNGSGTFDQKFAISDPHLWDGRNDPYLYQVRIAVKKNNALIDEVQQPLGLRYYSVSKDSGFYLNGRRYALHGVAMHEDRRDKGRAISADDRKQDMDILTELGCTSLRLSHYQHDQYIYDECDKRGIVVWTEIPVINYIDTAAGVYALNAKQQLTELIRQNYNHPSVCFWGIFNEIDYKPGPNPAPLICELNDLAHHLDSTRLTTGAAMFDDRPQQWIPDVISWNKYFGWYSGKMQDFGRWLDAMHKEHPEAKIGVSEYGVGANTQQHAQNPAQPSPGGAIHPEEYQALWHELQWGEIVKHPFLYMTSIWVGFDFASDGRREGMNPGVNDKGLVTQDRKIRKDAYYFYKANWSNDPVLYIASRRYTERTNADCEVKVYSNCNLVELHVNGRSYPMAASENGVFRSPKMVLQPGANTILAVGRRGGQALSDSCTWYLSQAQ